MLSSTGGEVVQVAPLGKGAFGAVSVVKWDNDYCALKQISKSLVVKSQLVTHIKAEKRIMSECDSPFLVRMRASFQDSQHLYLLMDFVQVRPHAPRAGFSPRNLPYRNHYRTVDHAHGNPETTTSYKQAVPYLPLAWHISSLGWLLLPPGGVLGLQC